MPKPKLAPVCSTKHMFVNYYNKGYQWNRSWLYHSSCRIPLLLTLAFSFTWTHIIDTVI